MKWLTLSFVLVVVVTQTDEADAQVVNTTQASCISAHASIDSNVVNQQCFPYLMPKGHCKHILGNTSLFANYSQQRNKEHSLELFEYGRKMLESYRILVSESCLKVFYLGYCKWYFQRCDLTNSRPMGQPICRESCEYVEKICAQELKMAKAFNKQQGSSGYPIYWNIINCTIFKYRNAGDLPECYYPDELNTETDRLHNKECYYGNGLGYRGNVTVTQSGHVCQSWSSQCPHRHRHPLAEYPELVNASNYCRNPGGQAPDGPWCYTTDRNKRWEYCNVNKCSDPAPTKAPDIVQAFSTGPYKIFIEWSPIPLPFVHGEPLGFRIRISKVGEDDPIINTTGMGVTYFNVENLRPLTNYSVQVVEFNKVGDGPLSLPVYVQTMPQNYVAVRFTAKLKNEKFTSDLLTRNTSQYRSLENTVRPQLHRVFKEHPPENYNIYQIKILRFFQGSVGVEFDITAKLTNTRTPSWSVRQSITGSILQKSAALNLMDLSVEGPPPPPANISQSDVTRTSTLIKWSAPAHSSPFSIINYTIQYKKSGTSMPYYTALIVDDITREVNVHNLDSNTQYLMRVASVNSYGTQPSEPIDVTTKASIPTNTPIAAIVVPVVVLSSILLVVGILFWRWWRKKEVEERLLKERIERLSENPYESAVDWFDLLKINVIKQWWEIPRKDLTLEDELGSGAFGVVRKGFLTKDKGKNRHGMYCAVKMLKESPTERELRDLCNEINFMSKIGDHPNIVSLIGACTINGPPWIVVKFAPNGCLLDYIKENRPLPDYENTVNQPPRKIITEKERLKFAYEIAQGMTHLEKYRYVHRDLAARNILLGKNMVAMVSDFGLSRDVYEEGKYENTAGGILPVRWMAIESLQDYTYTSKTDVWSYGVLLWEIESGGIVPYGGLSGLEILQKLKDGYRLEKPTSTSRDLYSIMWKCWNPDPSQRPSFSDLAYQVNGLLSCTGGYEPVVIKDNHAYDAVEVQDKFNEPEGNDAIELDIMKTMENKNTISLA